MLNPLRSFIEERVEMLELLLPDAMVRCGFDYPHLQTSRSIIAFLLRAAHSDGEISENEFDVVTGLRCYGDVDFDTVTDNIQFHVDNLFEAIDSLYQDDPVHGGIACDAVVDIARAVNAFDGPEFDAREEEFEQRVIGALARIAQTHGEEVSLDTDRRIANFMVTGNVYSRVQTTTPIDLASSPPVAGQPALAPVGVAPGDDGAPGLGTLLADLDAQVGLGSVKAEVRTLTNLARMALVRQENALKVVPTSRHLVFVGNPGTGKTTIARLLAQIYRSLGILSSGHLVEAARADLVAAYVGQTALKTEELFARARGGVLFIDEAYSLIASRHETDFEREAVDTLVKLMEDHRADTIVIVAGYTEPMTEFIDSNPGLRSRFKTTIHFPDYSLEELTSIFDKVVADYDYDVDERTRTEVAKGLAACVGLPAFGNARGVRQLVESAIGAQADRLAGSSGLSVSELRRLTVSDFTFAPSRIPNTLGRPLPPPMVSRLDLSLPEPT